MKFSPQNFHTNISLPVKKKLFNITDKLEYSNTKILWSFRNSLNFLPEPLLSLIIFLSKNSINLFFLPFWQRFWYHFLFKTIRETKRDLSLWFMRYQQPNKILFNFRWILDHNLSHMHTVTLFFPTFPSLHNFQYTLWTLLFAQQNTFRLIQFSFHAGYRKYFNKPLFSVIFNAQTERISTSIIFNFGFLINRTLIGNKNVTFFTAWF